MPEDSSVRFWNRAAARYARQPIANPDLYQAKLEMTWRYLGQDMDILEFGCGTGSTALLHAPKVRSVVAVDYSEQMIEIARGKLDDSGITNTTFKCTTLDDPAFEPAGFDAVLGLNVLHLIGDYAGAIRRARELLKPGGLLITSTVCLGRFSPLRLLLPAAGALGFIPRVQFLDRDAFMQSMTGNGFEILDSIEPEKGLASIFLIARRTGD